MQPVDVPKRLARRLVNTHWWTMLNTWFLSSGFSFCGRLRALLAMLYSKTWACSSRPWRFSLFEKVVTSCDRGLSSEWDRRAMSVGWSASGGKLDPVVAAYDMAA